MTPERWKQVEDVYDEVMAGPASARERILSDLCGGDGSLRLEVESLLEHTGSAATFLESPAVVAAGLAGPRALIGRQVGSYLFDSPLGEGGMGEVYRARDLQLGRDVAIKLLPRLSSSDPELVARFAGEARILAAFNYPHIGGIYGFEHVDGSPALVLELVEGETLAERIARAHPAGMPLREVLTTAAQIAAALEAAHARSIVHRDLKPSNIKITPAGVVKVLDFGLAKVVSQAPPGLVAHRADASRAIGSTRHGAVLGTAGYMSPEQAAGTAVDQRGDLWAFAVVLFEMLTGSPVFAGDTVPDVISAVLTIEPDWTTLPATTPVPLRLLLRQCLEKDPARRLETAAAARWTIEQALAAVAASPDVTATGGVRRRRLPAIAVPVVVIIAVVILAGGVWRLWQQDYFWQNPLAGATVERLTDFDGDEFDAAISPDGRLTTFLSNRDGPLDAWVSTIGSGTFVNLTQGRFQLTANRVTRQSGFSGDGKQVWFLQQVGGGPVGWTSGLAPAGGGAPHPFVENGLNPVWSPDGQRVVYHSADPGDPIFIADKNGNRPRRVYQAAPGIHNHHPTWSPDGRFVYFTSGTAQTEEMDIWRIPASAVDAAAPAERMTSHRAWVSYMAFLDGRTLVYTATADDGSGQWLYAMDVRHRIPHRVSSGVAEEYLSVAISETRPRRLVAALATPAASIWTVPISDEVQSERTVTRIRAPNSRASSPRVAAPGHLVFLSSKGGGYGLWKRENDVDRELWRSSNGGVMAPPAISPDGRLIAFSSRRQGTTSLHVMNADGTNVRTLVSSLDVRGPASWSPDGKWVAVAANRGEGTRLFKVPADGGTPVRLLDALADQPVWSPDGRFILYSRLLAAGGDEIRAITPDGSPVPLPRIRVGVAIGTIYRFTPDGTALIALEGAARGPQNFFRVDLRNGDQRQLTDLAGGSTIRHFDVSPDGTYLVFDRVQLNSDIVLMNLAR